MAAIAAQLMNARTALKTVAGANAALEARLLAAHAWGMSAEQLVLCGNESRDEAAYAALVARRIQAEPVSQILGSKDFWKDTFAVSRDVLTPRADSETIIETLLRLRADASAPLRILDLGTGSGCLVLSALREYRNATAVAVDASEAALAIAAQNAAALEVANRIELLRSDWCSKVDGTFDVVLSNPPYIPTEEICGLDADVQVYEPHSALDGGTDGLDCYRSIVQQLVQHLHPNALVLFEVGMGQAKDVAAIGKAANWNLIEIVNDLAGIARVVAFETN
ncbi:MAG: peptide chain release factor N(5)-glutamine methyltransferase [Rickettsiales bacterium]